MAVAGRYTANCERVRPSSRVDLESGESPIRAANSIHGGREPTFASINRPVANARPTIAINKLCPTTKLTGGLSGTRRCVRQHWICPPTPCPVGASTDFSACGPPTLRAAHSPLSALSSCSHRHLVVSCLHFPSALVGSSPCFLGPNCFLVAPPVFAGLCVDPPPSGI